MSNKPINDGGPAFPLNDPLKSTGMTLRDYFAAAALEKASIGLNPSADEIAKIAYYIADAMLKAKDAK